MKNKEYLKKLNTIQTKLKKFLKQTTKLDTNFASRIQEAEELLANIQELQIWISTLDRSREVSLEEDNRNDRLIKRIFNFFPIVASFGEIAKSIVQVISDFMQNFLTDEEKSVLTEMMEKYKREDEAKTALDAAETVTCRRFYNDGVRYQSSMSDSVATDNAESAKQVALRAYLKCLQEAASKSLLNIENFKNLTNSLVSCIIAARLSSKDINKLSQKGIKINDIFCDVIGKNKLPLFLIEPALTALFKAINNEAILKSLNGSWIYLILSEAFGECDEIWSEEVFKLNTTISSFTFFRPAPDEVVEKIDQYFLEFVLSCFIVLEKNQSLNSLDLLFLSVREILDEERNLAKEMIVINLT